MNEHPARYTNQDYYRRFPEDYDRDVRAWHDRQRRNQEKPAAMSLISISNQRGKTEKTALGHTQVMAARSLITFGIVGGAAGAIIGNVTAWQHLNWIPALFISIATLAVAVGVISYASEL